LTTALLVALLALTAVVAIIAYAVTPGRAASATRGAMAERLDAMERAVERIERAVRDEVAASRAEASREGAQQRDEVRSTLKQTGDSMDQRLDRFAAQLVELSGAVAARLDQSTIAFAESSTKLRTELVTSLQKLADANEKRLGELRAAVDAKLQSIQEDNGKRLEAMRQTVDEKLQGTLEKRLGESFKLVGDRLEAVQAGLGEMRTLASGVGDLKKVLSNVKVRGTWGEVQLGNLLAQMLAPEQYATNVATRPQSSERVEYAIRLPGGDDGDEVLLPVDSKFPMEDYQRLADAAERGDVDAVEASAKQLEAAIKLCAEDIRSKYLNPPHTTDFGILFLPTEGLYAEVIRRTGLADLLQREYRVAVAGPTTLAALLNSLQMGFRTLAIQKRSSEVWQVLAAVKTEFGKFGEVIDAVDKKLVEAQKKLNSVGTRSRAITRKLRDVEELPAGEAGKLLPAGLADAAADDDDVDVTEG
jgi:DNA recombination protein RmuC